MTACKGCGRAIIWGVTIDGKKIPLDLSPVYEVSDGTVTVDIRTKDSVQVQRTYRALVSHSATCPKSSDFSGRNKAKVQAEESSE